VTRDDTPLWAPSADRADATRLAAFRRRAGAPDYDALHAWSIEQPEEFWPLVWDDCGVVGDPGARVIERGEHFENTRFFPDAQLSVAENLLQPRAGVDPAAEALVAVDETGARVSRSWEELRADAAAMAAALRLLGVQPGDRVVTWLPNALEAVIVMLGATLVGAVYSSTSPDFGAHGVLDRFGQIEPVVLFAADSYIYGGKRFDCLERLDQIRVGLPTLRATVVVGVAPADTVGWEAFLAPHRNSPLAPEPFAFDHPWYVLSSSGTTGVPKCIVHRAGGVLLQHLKEHQLHCDIRAGDRVMYFTTTGWMMWNWLASTLASGATAVLYDGSPFHPGPHALFDIADSEQLTLLGVSAKFIDAVGKAGIEPITTHRLDTLRTICSTGSPLSPDGFRVVYERIKRDVHLASIAGGTDLCGCLVSGDPTGPVYAGEIQRPALGMAIDVAADDGSSLRESPGVPGELVCRQPFPSMPLGFWGDETSSLFGHEAGSSFGHEAGERYHAAYFARFPEVWAHGDFASWTVHGGMVIHGRSDATLNPGGIRIGTAEIYRVVESMAEVLESLAFGQQWDGDVRIVLLVRLVEGATLTDELAAEIRSRIRTECSPRHVPAVVAQVDDLPRTRSNKLVELAVADAVHGRPVRNTEALANPEAIDAIVALPELAT
jgi:acetoacetyl-CoA synthetase